MQQTILIQTKADGRIKVCNKLSKILDINVTQAMFIAP